MKIRWPSDFRAEPRGGRTRTRRGFTITEMVVATFLSVLLAVLLAAAVATFARPAVEVEGRTRLALEASLAVEALARDLGGFVADTGGNPQGAPSLTQYNFLDWSPTDNGSTLLLTFQGADPGSTVSVRYYKPPEDYQLIRTSIANVPSIVVAHYVTGFQVATAPDNSNNLQIKLTLTYPDPSSPRYNFLRFQRTYVLEAVKPR